MASPVKVIRGSIDDSGNVTMDNHNATVTGYINLPFAVSKATILAVEQGGTATDWSIAVYGVPGTGVGQIPTVAGHKIVEHTDTVTSGVIASDTVDDHVLTSLIIVPTLTDLGTADGFEFELALLGH